MVAKRKQKPSDLYAASLTIYRAGDMTPKGRAWVAAWLRRAASELVREGKDYGPRFRGKLWRGRGI